MKTILLTALVLAMSFFAYSQTIVENPKTGMSTASNVQLLKIELRDTATVMWFHVNQTPGNWISIPKETYIQPAGSNEKLYIKSAEGIEINGRYTMPASGEVNYQLLFPKVDASVSRLDYGEANDGGSWFIFDICIKAELQKSLLPETLCGDWFRADNGQWEISLFDSVAIYKSKVWKCLSFLEKDGLVKIKIKSGAKTMDIYSKTSTDGTCQIGETATKMAKYTRQPDESVIPADNETYKLPLLKVDTVTYCGYIKGFSPRFPQRTGMVYVNDIFVGTQLSYLIKIADDGTFNVKFPHSNPQTVYVRFPFSVENIIVEPGKTTFQLIDNTGKRSQSLFMGDCARVNTDLGRIKNIKSFNYYQMLERVLDFSPEQYKAYLNDILETDLKAVDDFALNHPVCDKAVQVKKMELQYSLTSNFMEYAWSQDAAYRKKNNVPQDQREIPFKPAKPDSSYYSFLTNDLVNNQLAVLISEYYFFINRVMYLDIVRGNPKQNSIAEIIAEMDKAGYKLTPEEKELAALFKDIQNPEMKAIQEEFQNKYGKQSKDFYQKYNEKLQPFYRDNVGKEISTEMTEAFLLGQNVQFTDKEKAFLVALKQYNENPLVKKNSSIQAQNIKKINAFSSNHRVFIYELGREGRIAERNEKMQKVLGIQPGFVTDVMASQDFCQPIVKEMSPCPADKIKSIQSKITTPFIASYIALKNAETLSKIEANKKQTGSKVNEVPKSAGDKVFDAIMSKYKGKVVYVDFWATWCGPCRSGIERIQPLKDEMANEKVAFVYITNPSSPKATYDNMIPTIKGEHYRVTTDEWNILSGMFKISGIPHYVLVGKDGKVINPELGHLENEQLKALLMKHIKE
jgi:thiol-disulfide isomerase/thioredoxin